MERDQRSPRIVIGLDGSAGSAHALQWVIDMAKRLDAEVVAVHVESLPIYIPAPMGIVPPPETPEQQAELRQIFATEWCAPLKSSGVRFRAIVEEGAAAGMALIEVGMREGADMIVVGSRGHSGVVELLLGSVSHQVAHHSAIPVVIIPPAVRVKAEAKIRVSEVRQPALLPIF
jgi:nucleotide-binding universal stress UspA family protein